MIVENRGGKGNPNHDDATGEFTTKNGGGTSLKIQNNASLKHYDDEEIERDILDGRYAEDGKEIYERLNDQQKKELIAKLKNHLRKENEKPIGSMTDEELDDEINETWEILSNNYINFANTKEEFYYGDKKAQCIILRTLRNCCETFNVFDNPILMPDGKIRLDFTKLSKNVPGVEIADVSYFGNSTSVYMNNIGNILLNNMLPDYDSIKRKRFANEVIGWCHVTATGFDSAGATIAHEFGHIVGYVIMNKVFGNAIDLRKYLEKGNFKKISNTKKELKKIFAEIKKDILDIYKKDYPGGDQSKKFTDISGYGAKNPLEWFAEAFSCLACVDPENPIAKSMYKYLKRNGVIK